MREIDQAKLDELEPETLDEVNPKKGTPPGSHRQAKLRWQKRLPGKLKHALFRQEPNGDRSETLFALGAALLERGVSPNDTWWLLYGSKWGQSKYGNRPHEVTRLVTKLKRHVNSAMESPAPRRENVDRGEWENLYELLGQDIPAPQWLIEHVWGENNYGMMAGQAKVHKTWLALDMAISISSGKPFLDTFEVKDEGPVMVVEAEVRRHSMRFRSNLIAEAKGIHATVTDGVLEVPHIHPVYLRRDTHMDLTDPDHMEMLEREVKKKKPKLMILDPLQFMLGEGDENQARDVRQALLPLSEIALGFDCAVCVVHHFRKNTDDIERGGQKASGSQAFHAWGESNLWVEYYFDNAVKIEREFRDHDSPGEMEVTFHIGGDHYIPEVEELKPHMRDEGESKIADGPLGRLAHKRPGISAKKAARELDKAERTVRNLVEKDPKIEFRKVISKKGGRPRHGIFPKGYRKGDED